MLTFLTIITCLLGPAAHAGDLKNLGKNIERESRKLRDKTEHELNNAVKDIKNEVIPTGFKPLSREIPTDQTIGADTYWLGIVGDSSVTGAVASPRFHVTVERVAQILGDLVVSKKDQKLEARVEDFKDPAKFKIIGSVEPLTRTMYTRAEFDRLDHDRDGASLMLRSRFSQAVDTEEYAFPYLIGRALDITPARIVLAAQDGKKISAMGEQLDRLLEVPGAKSLPPLVIASFVANDLCHPDNFEKPIEHFTREYSRGVREAFDRLAQLPAAPGGTRLMFVAPLDVSAVLTNPAILNQEVEFESSKRTSCRSIHDGTGVHGDVAKKLQTMLIGACRGILKPGPDADAHLQRVRDMQEIQFATLDREIGAFNARGLKTQITFATSARHLELRTGDAAADCFHPSPAGHEHWAARLLKGEFKDLRSQL